MGRPDLKQFLAALVLIAAAAPSGFADDWFQWGRDSQHSGRSQVVGQPLNELVADVVYDPFVQAEMADGGGDLFVHYQVPLLDRDEIYMEFKSGSYAGLFSSTQKWTIRKLKWNGAQLAEQWTAISDWQPPVRGAGGPFFEPVFHAVLTASYLYMPGAGGSVLQVNRTSGVIVRRISPFSVMVPTDPGNVLPPDDTFVAGPLVADAAGNVYYNAVQLNLDAPWTADSRGAWLVRAAADGTFQRLDFSTIVKGAPAANDLCRGVFSPQDLPWPPSPNAVPPSDRCGPQRPGINAAPAIAQDGTIYLVSRAHLNSRYSYLVAVNGDLTPKWSASMRDLFNDGCNVLLPPNGMPGGCRAGAATGVDPSDNTPGAGTVADDSTSSPVVAPDGSIIYGTYTRYNYQQGHMVHFSPAGVFLGSYPFGWDVTPAIYAHDGTWSLVTKENHYDVPSYCNNPVYCPPGRTLADPEAYFITQLDTAMTVQWQFRSTNTLSCQRDANGTPQCGPDHPNGFEWCVNAPAIDARGVVYANSEDGNLYAINQGGTVRQPIFLDLALGAAYTPTSIGFDGRIYTQNAGHLFVVGGRTDRRRVARH